MTSVSQEGNDLVAEGRADFPHAGSEDLAKVPAPTAEGKTDWNFRTDLVESGIRKGADELYWINPGIMDRDPNQPRKQWDLAKLANLKASMASYGQLVPAVVRKHPEMPARFMIVDGEGRWRVASRLGSEVLAIIVSGDLAASRVLALQVQHNQQREKLGVIDEANTVIDYMKRCQQEGMHVDLKRACATLRLPYDRVWRAKRILESFCPEYWSQIGDQVGQIPRSAAFEIASVPSGEQPALCEAVIKGTLSWAELKKQVRKLAPKARKGRVSGPVVEEPTTGRQVAKANHIIEPNSAMELAEQPMAITHTEQVLGTSGIDQIDGSGAGRVAGSAIANRTAAEQESLTTRESAETATAVQSMNQPVVTRTSAPERASAAGATKAVKPVRAIDSPVQLSDVPRLKLDSSAGMELNNDTASGTQSRPYAVGRDETVINYQGQEYVLLHPLCFEAEPFEVLVGVQRGTQMSESLEVRYLEILNERADHVRATLQRTGDLRKP